VQAGAVQVGVVQVGAVREPPWIVALVCSRARRALFRMARSRGEIENQGFNDARNRYGFEHICHQAHPLAGGWLTNFFALCYNPKV
jgi:hypothetical protein